MSGIAGIIHFDGKPVEPGLIEKMTSAMAHRGPDGINHWVKGSVALGQCMLRTTPESLEEHQPLTNEDESLVLVMDGRVDNWEELRRELLGRGAVLRDRSDAELVLRAYAIWGEECPDRIIGEYVFFVWDVRQRRLFGARDAAGTRHFYYHAGNGWFGFASEIRGLMALGLIEPRLNELRLLDYIVPEFGREDQEGTFYREIKRLPSGSCLSSMAKGTIAWRYWNPANLTVNKFGSVAECIEAFVEQLTIAVGCRMRSIGPVGAMLSGGLDSSSIVGLVRKCFRNQLRQPLRTFSLIREDSENCPDWQCIDQMLKENWLRSTIITSAIPKPFQQDFYNYIEYADEPFIFSHGLGNFIIYHAASDSGCRSVLEGMGGDLLFYGYNHTLDAIFRTRDYKRLPRVVSVYRRHGIDMDNRDLARRFLSSILPERARAAYRQFKSRKQILRNNLKLLHRETAVKYLAKRRVNSKAGLRAEEHENDQFRHSRYFTSGLLSFSHEVYGQIALGRGVEPRSPYSDRRMIEFAIAMPLEAKLFTSWYKMTLRKGMDGILPDAVRFRRDLGGHPGWKFYEKATMHVIQHAPEIWNLANLCNNLRDWVDVTAISKVWHEYSLHKDYEIGYNLHNLAILARWIRVHQIANNP